MDIVCTPGGEISLAEIFAAINSKVDKLALTGVILPFNSNTEYSKGNIAYIPSLGPVEYINIDPATGISPATDDGTTWVNWLNIVEVADSNTAFGMPIKNGTLILDKTNGRLFKAKTLLLPAQKLSDSGIITPMHDDIVAVAYSASVALDFGVSRNFLVTATGGAFTMLNPTNMTVGQSGKIFIAVNDTAPTWDDSWNNGPYPLPSLTNTLIGIQYTVLNTGVDGIVMSIAEGY